MFYRLVNPHSPIPAFDIALFIIKESFSLGKNQVQINAEETSIENRWELILEPRAPTIEACFFF
jgi:hypothetical protein